jgi:hypothetical protein
LTVGLLVYGFARSGDARRATAGVVGCVGEPLSAVAHEGLAAIVGEVEHAPGARLEVLRAFQTAVTALHERAALVPARFGSIGEADEVRRVMAGRDTHLHATLDLIEGCEEWSVRVRGQARGEATGDEPAVLAPAGEVQAGRAYLRRRKEAFDHADGVSPELVELCRGALRELVGLARATRLEGANGTVGMPGVHLLVPRDERGEVGRVFGEALRAMGGRALLTGPWPAYSFVDATA